jgi:hypothetical protein
MPQAAHFGGTGTQFIDTNSMNVVDGSIIQFYLNTGCLGAATDFSVNLHYTDTLGANGANPTPLTAGTSWLYALAAQPNPAAPPYTGSAWVPPPGQINGINWLTSSLWVGGSVFFSREYSTDYLGRSLWTRVTIPLTNNSLMPYGRRFRLIAERGGSTSEWAIAKLYIGPGCPTGCLGHGDCVDGACVCDTGYMLSGANCVPSSRLPSEALATFGSLVLDSNLWATANGGAAASNVNLADGFGFVFSGSNPRKLITIDLDTTVALFLEMSLYCSTTQDIVVSYSSTGGMSWATLASTYVQSSRSTFQWVVMLPPAAKTPATRFMFWMPLFTGGSDLAVCLNLHHIFLKPDTDCVIYF